MRSVKHYIHTLDGRLAYSAGHSQKQPQAGRGASDMFTDTEGH